MKTYGDELEELWVVDLVSAFCLLSKGAASLLVGAFETRFFCIKLSFECTVLRAQLFCSILCY